MGLSDNDDDSRASRSPPPRGGLGVASHSATRGGDDKTLEAMGAENLALYRMLNSTMGKDIANVKNAVEVISLDVTALKSTQDSHSKRLESLELDIKKLKEGDAMSEGSVGRVSATGGTGGGGGGNPYSGGGGGDPDDDREALKRRSRTLIVGGFDRDTHRDDIIAAVRALLGNSRHVEDVTTPGRFASIGRALWVNPSEMWKFIKDHAGTKLTAPGIEGEYWFTTDKTESERLVAK